MLMNNQISFSTDGIKNNSIEFKNFESNIYQSLINNNRHELHTGDLVIGDTTITIHFESAEEICEFCELHNIEYFDQRELDNKEEGDAA